MRGDNSQCIGNDANEGEGEESVYILGVSNGVFFVESLDQAFLLCHRVSKVCLKRCI